MLKSCLERAKNQIYKDFRICAFLPTARGYSELPSVSADGVVFAILIN
jgi:hypothetical protein